MKYIFLFFIILFFQNISIRGQSKHYYQSYINFLRNKAEKFLLIHPDSSIHYSNIILNNLQAVDNDTTQASIFLILASVYERKGDYNVAKEYTFKALSIFEHLNNTKGQIDALITLGNIEYKTGNYEIALYYLRKSMIWAAKTNNYKLLAEALNTTGNVYLHSKQYAKAKVFHEQSLKIYSLLSDSIGIAFTLNNLAGFYMKTNQLQTSIQLLENAKEIAIKKNFILLQSNILNNLGHIYARLGNYKKAEKYMLSAIVSARKYWDIISLTTAYANITYVYLQTNQLEKAKKYLDSALYIAKKHQIVNKLPIIYRNYSAYFEQIKDYKNAYHYFSLYHVTNDSLLNEQFIKQANRFEKELQNLKKDQEIVLKDKENQILLIKNQRKNLIILFFLCTLILMTILTFFLIKVNIKNRNQNKKLKLLNLELENKNQQLLSLQKTLEETIRTKDTFLSILSHDLRTPFSSLISYIRVVRRDFMNLSADKNLQYLTELEYSLEKIHNLLDNLLLWSKLSSKKISIKPEIFNLFQIITETIQLLEEKIQQKNLKLINNVPKSTFITADRNMIQTILRNLLDNSIKYTLPNGEIIINFELNEQTTYKIYVIDNGIGFSDESIESFLNKTLPIKKSSDHSTGLGLQICQDFANMHGGFIEIISEKNKSSKVIVHLKKLPLKLE